jgi:uncharacterized Zn finger protein
LEINAMANMSRTWWGQKFIAALEDFTDAGRLSRGRSYARGNKVKHFEIIEGSAVAQVRGSVNPYFGVYEEPLYTTAIDFQPISKAKWAAIIALIASKASLISRLMLNEIPETIEEPFAALGLGLLPQGEKDFDTHCSCPDWSNPCKHIAGVHYLLAARIDQDPFLLFELRGLSREDLQAELAKSPLGQALSQELQAQVKEPVPVDSYHPQPQLVTVAEQSLKDFWQGEQRSQPPDTEEMTSGVPAILIKKQGDFPPFWQRDNSFIAAMEALYQRVKTKNKGIL